MNSVTAEEIEALQAKRHWPWPLALAYVQPKQHAAVAAASEALIVYPEQGGFLSECTASAAIQLIYSAVTGKPNPPEPITGTDTLGESYDVKSGEQIYWEDVSGLEADLLGALEAGQVQALGRKTPTGDLEAIPATAWVRGEIRPEATSDLIEQGWRRSGSLSRALGEKEFAVRYYDIHLTGDVVRQYAEALKRARDAKISEETFGVQFERIEQIQGQSPELEQGYWSLLVAGVWASSCSNSLTAAVQQFEKEMHADRSGVHSASIYWCVGDFLARRGFVLLSSAIAELAKAAQRGAFPGASGYEGRVGSPRKIERHEWRGFRGPHHEPGGVEPLPNIFNVGLPSEEVLAEFPGHLESEDEQGLLEGVLPVNASASARSCKAHAELAADLIRRGVATDRAKAIRAAIEEEGLPRAGTQESNERAVRIAFDLMFQRDGQPIQIDQN